MGVLALMMATPAFAQDQSAELADDTSEDIIVTGTSIRGVAPAGATVVSIDAEEVQATGASDTIDILRELPQAVGFFNAQPQPGAGSSTRNDFAPISRVVLRPIGTTTDIITNGGQLTLILIDGHRVVAGGIGQFGVDINAIPPSLLERVEIITDGGSAVYGSDGITGVMNFVTRRSFDGVEFNGHYGFADGYETSDGTLTVGRDYGSGSIFASYNYSQNDALFGRDRDYIRSYAVAEDLVTPRPGGTQCDTSNVSVGAADFRGTDFARIQDGIRCDTTDHVASYPEQYRHSLTLGWSQDLNEVLRLDVRGYFTRQNTIGYIGPFRQTLTITEDNPYYHDLGGAFAGANQSVSFSYGPALGNYSSKRLTQMENWQFFPELSWDLPFDWQVRGSLSYGESEVQYENTVLRTDRANAAVAAHSFANALNPYDIAQTNSAVLASLLGRDRGVGLNQFSDARIIADGPLFALPGGELRGAIGAETARSEFRRQQTDTNTLEFREAQSLGQDVSALFAELQVPIVGQNNSFPLVHSLFLQGSIRQDTYSDFGETTNTAFGLTYEPVDWITFTANKSEAFVAPTVIEQLEARSPTAFCTAGAPPRGVVIDDILDDDDHRATCPNYISIGGGIAPRMPQIAENYSLGLELRPPILEGLTLRANFYHTLLLNRSGGIPFGNADGDYRSLYAEFDDCDENADVFFCRLGEGLTPAVLERYRDIVANPEFFDDYLSGDRTALILIDNRTRNNGALVSEGWDVGADYVHVTDWGSLDASIGATIPNVGRSQKSPEEDWLPLECQRTGDRVNLRYVASLGATIGNWRLQARESYTGPSEIVIDGTCTRTPGSPRGHTEPRYVTDLFFRYDVDGEGWGEDLSFTLNIDDVFFDGDPTIGPYIRTDTGEVVSPSGSSQVGRLVQFGVTKRF
jgi:iron complex outermembrane receptor protein